MYSEFATDPKVQSMSEAMQRRLTMLFCIQSGNGIETFHETDRETLLCFMMRITPGEMLETRTLFIRLGFIKENWTLCNWKKRQYISDVSTQRVRKHREAKQRETFHETVVETNETVSETPPEQNRTDTEQKQNKEEARPVNVAVTSETNFEEWSAQVYERHPKKSNHVPAMQALFQYFGKDEAARVLFDKNHLLWCASEDWRSNPRFVPSLYNNRDGTGFIPDGAWKKPPVNGAGPPKRKSAIDLALEQMDEEDRRSGT